MMATDGNTVAGLLRDIFGQEMTVVYGTCIHCGSRSQIGRAMVFRGLGTVLVCPTCEGRLMVIVDRAGVACVDAEGLANLEMQRPRPRLLAKI
ncbi:DUF6510 family protein [Micromonospora musae]|uniref:DUF6510 family protein n=1 Tax=Micromonospora musae TaxID=1894970 RepID=UPI0033D67220